MSTEKDSVQPEDQTEMSSEKDCVEPKDKTEMAKLVRANASHALYTSERHSEMHYMKLKT